MRAKDKCCSDYIFAIALKDKTGVGIQQIVGSVLFILVSSIPPPSIHPLLGNDRTPSTPQVGYSALARGPFPKPTFQPLSPACYCFYPC